MSASTISYRNLARFSCAWRRVAAILRAGVIAVGTVTGRAEIAESEEAGPRAYCQYDALAVEPALMATVPAGRGSERSVAVPQPRAGNPLALTPHPLHLIRGRARDTLSARATPPPTAYPAPLRGPRTLRPRPSPTSPKPGPTPTPPIRAGSHRSTAPSVPGAQRR